MPQNSTLTSKKIPMLTKFNLRLIKLENGCHVLCTKPNNKGYSIFKHSGKTYLAHVFIYKETFGLEDGLQVHHKCENKRCVNPEHLKALTGRAHMLEHPNCLYHKNMLKTHCPKGHEYTLENTKIYKGSRFCIACSVVFKRNYKALNP